MAEEPENKSWLALRVWGEVKGFFVLMFESVWAGFVTMPGNVLDKLWKGYQERYKKVEKVLWAAMLQRAVELDALDTSTVQRLMKLRDLPPPLDTFAFVFAWITIITTMVSQSVMMSLQFVQRKFNQQFRPKLPEYREILPAAFIAPEKTAEIRTRLAEDGYADKDIDLFFLALYKALDPDTVRQLYLRKLISKDEMHMHLRELGFTDRRIALMEKIWQLVPGPGDLLTMVAHEAFEPDVVSKIGLEDEFPAAQSEHMEAVGLSNFWQKKYWASHWEQPSIQMGYQMLHREDPDRPGHKVIDKGILDMLYKIVEIPPFWRERLTKIAYHPLTRVDVRRMHAVGILDEVGLQTAYENLGFHPFTATQMTEFTLRYNTEDEKDLTKSEVLKGYREKLLDEPEGLALLKLAGYGSDIAEYFLRLEDYKQELDYQNQLVKAVKLRYTENLITDMEARDRLGKLNLPGRQIELYMERWQLDRFLDRKLPSKADLDKFLRTHIIEKDTYRLEMTKLGYGVRYTGWYEKYITQPKGK